MHIAQKLYVQSDKLLCNLHKDYISFEKSCENAGTTKVRGYIVQVNPLQVNLSGSYLSKGLYHKRLPLT